MPGVILEQQRPRGRQISSEKCGDQLLIVAATTNRLHFGRPQSGEENQYIRFAYSGINVPDIVDGLARLKDWAES